MPRGEKRARQHAALQVLQQAGYSVTFDAPSVPVPGAYGGGGPPARGQLPPNGPPRQTRYAGKSLDARHARAAAAQQPAVSRDAYMAGLADELG